MITIKYSLDEGLIGKYSFNNDFSDSSSLKNDAVFYGQGTFTEDFQQNPISAFGVIDADENFKISIPHHYLQRSRSATYSLWVKTLTANASYSDIVVKSATSSELNGFKLQERGGKIVLKIFGESTDASDYLEIEAPHQSVDDWLFVTFSYDIGNKAALYINGNLIKEIDSCPTFTIAEEDILIGNSYSSTSTNGFQGIVDEFSIRDRYLNESEVYNLFKGNESLGFSHLKAELKCEIDNLELAKNELLKRFFDQTTFQIVDEEYEDIWISAYRNLEYVEQSEKEFLIQKIKNNPFENISVDQLDLPEELSIDEVHVLPSVNSFFIRWSDPENKKKIFNLYVSNEAGVSTTNYLYRFTDISSPFILADLDSSRIENNTNYYFRISKSIDTPQGIFESDLSEEVRSMSNDKLLSYYPFSGGSSNNFAQNDFHGTGAEKSDFTHDLYNTEKEALYLNGEFNSYVKLHNSPAFENDFTFSTWLNPMDSSKSGVISELANPNGSGGFKDIVQVGRRDWSNDLELSLVSHYSFDSDLLDHSLNYIDGLDQSLDATRNAVPVVASSEVFVNDRFGNVGAIELQDGREARIADDTRFRYGKGTISCWIKADPAQAEERLIPILSKFEDDGSRGFHLLHSYEKAELRIRDNNTYLQLHSQKTPVIDGQWHFISFTYQRSKFVKLYVDGVLVNSLETSEEFDFPNTDLVIAHSDDPGIEDSPGVRYTHPDFFAGTTENLAPYKFVGELDDLMIFDRPLTDDQIYQIFQYGIKESSSQKGMFISYGEKSDQSVVNLNTHASPSLTHQDLERLPPGETKLIPSVYYSENLSVFLKVRFTDITQDSDIFCHAHKNVSISDRQLFHRIRWNSVSGELELEFRDAPTLGGKISFNAASWTPTLNTWHQIVVTYKNAGANFEIRLFIDGVELFSDNTLTRRLFKIDGNIVLGKNYYFDTYVESGAPATPLPAHYLGFNQSFVYIKDFQLFDFAFDTNFIEQHFHQWLLDDYSAVTFPLDASTGATFTNPSSFSPYSNSEFTFQTIIKVDDVPNSGEQHYIFRKGQNPPSANQTELAIFIDENLKINVEFESGLAGKEILISNNSISLFSSTTLTITIDGRNASIYLDGYWDSTNTISAVPTFNNEDIFFGSNIAEHTAFSGQVHGLELYSSVLSSSELQKLDTQLIHHDSQILGKDGHFYRRIADFPSLKSINWCLSFDAKLYQDTERVFPSSYWPMNDSSQSIEVEDKVSGRYATLEGSPVPTFGNDSNGKYLSFNSSNYLQVTSPEYFETQDDPFSISAWVLIPSSVTITTLTIVSNYADNDGGFRFVLNSSNQNPRLVVGPSTGGSRTATSTTTLARDAWHHIVAVWEPLAVDSEIRLYINGVLDHTEPLTGVTELRNSNEGSGDPMYPVLIGASPESYDGSTSPSRYFEGYIRDVSYFNHALELEHVVWLHEQTQKTIWKTQLARIGTQSTLNPSNSPSVFINKKNKIEVNLDLFSGSKERITSNAELLEEEDYKITITCEEKKVGIYINGFLDTFRELKSPPATSVSDLFLASADPIYPGFFGELNDLKLFNSCLEDKQIQVEAIKNFAKVYAKYSSDYNQWLHFSVSHDSISQEIKFYINGDHVRTISGIAYSLSGITERILSYIGKTNIIAEGIFNGKLDEIRLYDSAISREEILSLYENSKGWEVSPPLFPPEKVLFKDVNSNSDTISGTLIINKAKNEDDVLGYRVKWGSSHNRLLFNKDAILELNADNRNMSFPIRDWDIPLGAKFILVYSFNEFGENEKPAYIRIDDIAEPDFPANSIQFFDFGSIVHQSNILIDGGNQDETITSVPLGDSFTFKFHLTNLTGNTDLFFHGDGTDNMSLNWNAGMFNFEVNHGGSTKSFNSSSPSITAADDFYLVVQVKNYDSVTFKTFGLQNDLDETVEDVSFEVTIDDFGTGINDFIFGLAPLGLGTLSTDIESFTLFSLENSTVDQISGLVFMERAFNEELIKNYNLYWASDERTTLPEKQYLVSASVNQFSNQNNKELLLELDNVELPADTTHLILKTANEYGEMIFGVSCPIVDLGYPSKEAQQVSYIGGFNPTFSGLIYFDGAKDERSITHYRVYWGKNSTELIDTDALISEINSDNLTDRYEVELTNLVRPDDAKYFLIRSVNGDREMTYGPYTRIIDKVPEHTALEIIFNDNNSVVTTLSGEVSILRATDAVNAQEHEDDLDSYLLYWADENENKLPLPAIVEKKKEELTLNSNEDGWLMIAFDEQFIPDEAYYLLVYTENEIGESEVKASKRITDIGVPIHKADFVSFIDESLSPDKITGTIRVNAHTNSINQVFEKYLTDYVIYFGKNENEVIEPEITTLRKEGRNLLYYLTQFPKPADATHFIVKTRNNSSVYIMDEGVSCPILDASKYTFNDNQFFAPNQSNYSSWQYAPGVNNTADLPEVQDPTGEGWLRLTQGADFIGYALYKRPIPTKYGVKIEFDYAVWENSNKLAEGLCFFVTDDINGFSAGRSIKGMGYKGMANSMFGICFDNAGNLSGEPNSISILGSSRLETPEPIAALNIKSETGDSMSVVRAGRDNPKHVQIKISPEGLVTLRLKDETHSYESIFSNFGAAAITGLAEFPKNIYVGVCASSSKSGNRIPAYHEIRNFEITTVA